jgi:hypothetical protein
VHRFKAWPVFTAPVEKMVHNYQLFLTFLAQARAAGSSRWGGGGARERCSIEFIHLLAQIQQYQGE